MQDEAHAREVRGRVHEERRQAEALEVHALEATRLELEVGGDGWHIVLRVGYCRWTRIDPRDVVDEAVNLVPMCLTERVEEDHLGLFGLGEAAVAQA